MRNRMMLITALLILSACSKEREVIIQPARHWVERTVAVVAPLGEATRKARLERTAEWFLDNYHMAQKYDTLAVRLRLEWYDELSADLPMLSKELSAREDLSAIIGPFQDSCVALFAPECKKHGKTMIVPTATSEQVIRRYAIRTATGITSDRPFLWALTETDLHLTETLMSSFATLCQFYDALDNSSVLFTPDNIYGQTFQYWAPFFATQYGINLKKIIPYKSRAEIFHSLRGLPLTGSIFCVVEDTEMLAHCANYLKMSHPYFAFKDISDDGLKDISSDLLPALEGAEGFTPYADPTTGFELSYMARFGTSPTFTECKFYDALMLAGFAICYVSHNRDGKEPNTAMGEAIATITSVPEGKNPGGPAWNTTTMEIYLRAMEEGTLLPFKGASGDISFNPESYMASSATTYLHWQIYEGRILHRNYFGEGESNRIEGNSDAWDYLYDIEQAERDFDDQTSGASERQYPSLKEQYALLVQGSDGFDNYRHLSDVLSVYQLLRRGGFDDAHIILIADKSIPNSTRNPAPGIIRSELGGQDLLGGSDFLPEAIIDYDSADLTASDIASILKGAASDKLPAVVPQDAGNNVFFYWSGHGHSLMYSQVNEFAWRSKPAGEGFTGKMLRESLSGASFRKLLLIAEPCYGEAVIKDIEGIPGILAMSGAAEDEQSWADNWYPDAQVWMSDRFTGTLVDCLWNAPNISYRDLFLDCASRTLGSHAKVVNAAQFGNLHQEGPEEFIIKQ